MTTVDQDSGRSESAEPLRTLATFRKEGGKVLFGENLIHEGPGPVRTGITAGIPEQDKQAFARRRTALRRYAVPKEIAHAILHLVLPASGFITGAALVVDNTFATPLLVRPLELGADLVIHSTTKYMDGHNATLGGAVVAATEELHAKLRFIQKSAGMIMSPQVAWLTLQGVKTLSERMDRQSANAMEVASFLESHPKVEFAELNAVQIS